jgi:hypothetical protein
VIQGITEEAGPEVDPGTREAQDWRKQGDQEPIQWFPPAFLEERLLTPLTLLTPLNLPTESELKRNEFRSTMLRHGPAYVHGNGVETE